MPGSPKGNMELDVKDYLRQLPGAALSSLLIGETDTITLLRTDRVIAAFAFAEANAVSVYRSAYDTFKIESERQSEWDRYDLAFVLCVSPTIDKLDQLASDIETDVYFCRKFVVELGESIGHALARLPFLPLTPVNGPSLRPSSAQTFLQRSGVPAVLARSIVVQHERGADRIVAECIAGEFGEVGKIARAQTMTAVRADSNVIPVELESLTIENFRAYRRSQTFQIGKEITILYGPNGFGKTSFFDAIDFGVTGMIGRLRISSDDHFKKVAAHLDSNPKDARVTLTYRAGSGTHRIVRTVAEARHATLDGQKQDRKSVLKTLTAGGSSVAERVDNLISLFRATHLFSQDSQELTKNFSDHCSLPREIVSRMLAFEDYENAVRKASAIVQILDRDIEALSEEVEIASASLTAEKAEFDQLRKTTKDKANVGALNAELAKLRAALTEVGVKVGRGTADAAAVRGWRASLETRIAESESRIARLSALATEVTSLPAAIKEASDLRVRLAASDAKRSVAEQTRKATQAKLDATRKSIAEIVAQLAQAQTAIDNMMWVRRQGPVYRQLLAAARAQAIKLGRSAEKLTSLRSRQTAAIAEFERQTAASATANAGLMAASDQVARLEALRNNLPTWQANLGRLAEIDQTERVLKEMLITLRDEEPSLRGQLDGVTTQQNTLSPIVADADRSQSELKQLLSQLQNHIIDGTCPLCGEDHGSQSELVESIQRQIERDSASFARAELAVLRQRGEDLARQIGINRQNQHDARVQLNEFREQRSARDLEIKIFTNQALALGINTSPGLQELGSRVVAQLVTAREEIEVYRKVSQSASRATGEAASAVRTLQSEAALEATEQTALKTEQDRIQRELTSLRGDPRAGGISMDADVAELDRVESERVDRMSVLRGAHTGVTAEAAQYQEQIEGTARAMAELAGEISSIRSRLSEIEKSRAGILARLVAAGLPEGSNQAELIGHLSTETQMQARMGALQESVSSIEIGLDAATTAAAIRRLRDGIDERDKLIAEKKAACESRRPWRDYFALIQRLVLNEQAAAIANFTRQYGPRTSVIQRRLRSVYGFDDIEIDSHAAEIMVSVKRHGVELRPVDYFSQSQQQTLLLGLFLTACSGQNWSSFAPVFLDDPVTHFDDLNTYALLDLIVGLLKSDLGGRQFVISTCDEKFFQLARQKFRYLNDGARFYRFRAVGEDGPVVEDTFS